MLLLCAFAAAVGIFGCSIIRSQPSPETKTGTLQGVVTGPNGPIANAAISVTTSDATQHGALSNADGYYTLSGLPAGPATIVVRAAGFTEYDGSVVIATDPVRTEQNVSLNPQ